MHKNSHSKMEWFKNTYLKIENKLEILDIQSEQIDFSLKLFKPLCDPQKTQLLEYFFIITEF